MHEAEDLILNGLADNSSYTSGGNTSESEDDNQSQARSHTNEGYSNHKTNILATRGLDRAVFQFLVASICMRIGGDIYSNTLLYFYATIGIRQAPTGFTYAMLYTSILTILH
jgi:hypothetical protein